MYRSSKATRRRREGDVLWRRYLKAVALGDRVGQITLSRKLYEADYRTPA